MNRLTVMLLVGFSVLLTGSPAAASDISFSSAKNFNAGIHNPSCIATGDFDGDGYQDFAVINHFNNLAVFLGNGDGTFRTSTNFTLDFYVQGCVAAADFHNNHKLDIVVVGGSHGLALLTGRGDGTFDSPVYTETTLGGGSVSLAVGDLNNDGNLDIFVSGNGSSEALLGDGNGNFKEGQYVNGVRGFGVALGDFNGDGKLDVATPDPFSNTLYVLLGNGDGTFQAPQKYDTELQQCDAVAAADLNNDKNLDLAVTCTGAILIFFGHGDGTFTREGVFVVGFSLGGILAADFNKDGKVDLAASDFGALAIPPCTSGCILPPSNPPQIGSVGVVIVPGQGEATCSTILNIFPAGIPGLCQPPPIGIDLPTGMNPASVATADFNSDGSLDLVVANFGDGTISVLLNEAGTYIDAANLNASTEWENRPATFRVSVEGSVLNSVKPTGTVTLKIGAREVGPVELIDGQASITIGDIEETHQRVQVFYSGDEKFNPNQASFPIHSKNREEDRSEGWSRADTIHDDGDSDR